MKLPPAFEVCTTGKCDKPARGKTHGTGNRVETQLCKPSATCASPCSCRLFWIKEVDHPPQDDEREWIFGFPDEHGDVKYDEKNTYRCYCVKPVLPSGYTLMTGGSCAAPKVKDNKVSCVASSPCTSTKSTCVLFRLKKTTIGTLGGVNDRDAKWEMAAAEGKEADYDKDYYYECFCVT